jgi:hypothetical protein
MSLWIAPGSLEGVDAARKTADMVNFPLYPMTVKYPRDRVALQECHDFQLVGVANGTNENNRRTQSRKYKHLYKTN